MIWPETKSVRLEAFCTQLSSLLHDSIWHQKNAIQTKDTHPSYASQHVLACLFTDDNPAAYGGTEDLL